MSIRFGRYNRGQRWLTNELVFALSSLIIGAVIGGLLEDQWENGIDLASLLVLILSVVLFSTLFFVWKRLSRDSEQTESIRHTLQRIENGMGLDAVYQEVAQLNSSADRNVDYVRKVMAEAENEILILDYEELHSARDDNYDQPEIWEDSFAVILERLEEQCHAGVRFTYKRICQFHDPNTKFGDLNKIFIGHCSDMLRLGHQTGRRAYLKRTSVTYPTAFTIVDRKYLILQLMAVRRKNGHWENYLKGELIIHDPQRELINVFLKAWDEIEHSHDTHSVGLSDFA